MESRKGPPYLDAVVNDSVLSSVRTAVPLAKQKLQGALSPP